MTTTARYEAMTTDQLKATRERLIECSDNKRISIPTFQRLMQWIDAIDLELRRRWESRIDIRPHFGHA